ncbi:MAG: hypothetical protein ACR2P4_09140 [Gammaproteobacteria bacterium]
MRRVAIIALWIIAIVSGGFAVFGVMGHYGFMPLARIIAALGFGGFIGFCALLCNYPAVRRDIIIVLCIVAIVGCGAAIFAALINYYGFALVAKVVGGIVFVVVGGFFALAILAGISEQIEKAAASVAAFLKANPANAAGIIAAAAALIFAIAIVIIVVAVIIKIF